MLRRANVKSCFNCGSGSHAGFNCPHTPLSQILDNNAIPYEDDDDDDDNMFDGLY